MIILILYVLFIVIISFPPVFKKFVEPIFSITSKKLWDTIFVVLNINLVIWLFIILIRGRFDSAIGFMQLLLLLVGFILTSLIQSRGSRKLSISFSLKDRKCGEKLEQFSNKLKAFLIISEANSLSDNKIEIIPEEQKTFYGIKNKNKKVELTIPELQESSYSVTWSDGEKTSIQTIVPDKIDNEVAAFLEFKYSILKFSIKKPNENYLRVYLNNELLKLNTSYFIPKGRYTFSLEIDSEVLKNHVLVIDNDFHKSNKLELDLNNDKEIQLDFIKKKPGEIIFEVDNNNQNEGLSDVEKIEILNKETEKYYNAYFNNEVMMAKLPAGMYQAKIITKSLNNYFVKAFFETSKKTTLDFNIDYFENKTSKINITRLKLHPIYLSVDKSKNKSEVIQNVREIIISDKDGYTFKGNRKNNRFIYHLPSSEYLLEIKARDKKNADCYVYINGSNTNEYYFKVDNKAITIPFRVDVIKWPELEIKLSNPSKARVKVLVDNKPVKKENMMLNVNDKIKLSRKI